MMHTTAYNEDLTCALVFKLHKRFYVIGKWLDVYPYFSSYRRQIEVFSSVCFIPVCEILHSRKNVSTYFLKIPRSVVIYKS